MARLAVYLEEAPKRTFAGAVDWPGWERAGRGEAAALEAFVAAGPRYVGALGAVAGELRAPGAVADLDVVHRHRGGSGTEFGVPSEGPPADEEAVAADDLERLSGILRAAWAAFDAASAAAAGVELSKGPRGGGRDLDKIRAHVLDAERSYFYQLGGRHRTLPDEAPDDEFRRLRDAAGELLASRARGEPVDMGRRTAALWTPRYFVRRSAWHSLDHAWEIEDRSAGMTPDKRQPRGRSCTLRA